MSWKTFKEKGKVEQAEDARKLTLLVVDDERAIVDSIGEIFSSSFEILTTSSSTEALKLFKNHGPQLIITDQRMPEMSGLEFLRKVVELDPGTVRILVTGYSDINVVISALNEGLVWKYIAKPWDHDELRKIVLDGARKYVEEQGLEVGGFAFRGFMGL